MAGFGGALKNIGMGCGSRAGKMEMHNAGKPRVKRKKMCGLWYVSKFVLTVLLQLLQKASIDHNKCVGCGRCIGICPHDAVFAVK